MVKMTKQEQRKHIAKVFAKINDDLIEPSPFLTEILRKYDEEAKEARKKVDA